MPRIKDELMVQITFHVDRQTRNDLIAYSRRRKVSLSFCLRNMVKNWFINEQKEIGKKHE